MWLTIGVTPVIAALGDSITDGDQRVAPNEPIDLNVRYPDLLSEAIIAEGKSASVVNLGVSGHQVLQLGQVPAERLERDVSNAQRGHSRNLLGRH